MQRTKSEVYLHIVWATKGREPLLTDRNESRIHRCIQDEAQRLNAVVLALGGMPNHVHPAVRVPTAVSIADLVKPIKRTSSAFANKLPADGSRFRWEDNYSVFS